MKVTRHILATEGEYSHNSEVDHVSFTTQQEQSGKKNYTMRNDYGNSIRNGGSVQNYYLRKNRKESENGLPLINKNASIMDGQKDSPNRTMGNFSPRDSNNFNYLDVNSKKNSF